MVLSEYMTLHEISDREESKGQVFVIVSTYRAKPGEEDAIIALHEDWQRKQGNKAKVYLSWELLRNTKAPSEFIVIAYFESEELARAMVDDLNQEAWYLRLVSLVEEGPVCTDYRSEWQLT
jgi:heme-degrading monooxygenase HmoA